MGEKTAKTDIYNTEGRLKKWVTDIEQGVGIGAGVSQKNREAILGFCRYITANNRSVHTVAKVVHHLTLFGKWIKKDFEDYRKEDIEKLLGEIETRKNIKGEKYAAWSKQGMRVTIKMFWKWLRGENEYPPEVAWVNTSVAARDTGQDIECLTEDEILKLIQATNNQRDKALISFLYESGARIGEVLHMRIKDIEFMNGFAYANLPKGKRGGRRIPIISSTPHLSMWLKAHPKKENRDAFLWVVSRTKTKGDRLSHSAVYKILRDVGKRAGIEKATNPHIFRHSRATFLAGHLTESQMGEYLWGNPASRMASVYVHFSDRDLINPIKKLHGVEVPEKPDESILKPQVCLRCKCVNPPDAHFCIDCAAPLSLKIVLEMQEKKPANEVQKLNLELAQILQSPAVMAAIEKELERRMEGKATVRT